MSDPDGLDIVTQLQEVHGLRLAQRCGETTHILQGDELIAMWKYAVCRGYVLCDSKGEPILTGQGREIVVERRRDIERGTLNLANQRLFVVRRLS